MCLLLNQSVYIACICCTILQYKDQYKYEKYSYVLLESLLFFRLFKQIFTSPFFSGLIISITYILKQIGVFQDFSDIIFYSPLIQLICIFSLNFCSRILIWVYSLLKMNSSKKQRIQRLQLFNFLQMTLFFPLNMISLALSSMLDVPFLPVFGLPVYFCGFPRPKRFWERISSSNRQTNEAFIYEKFSKNLQKILGNFLLKKSFLKVGDFYLLRFEKYIGIIQILECGNNYTIVQFKGLESQEMTSCHSIECNQIDRIIEETFIQKKCFFKDFLGAALPFGQQNINMYDENQLQFTGIITDEDFIKGFSEILVKVLVYFIHVFFEENEFFQLDEFLNEFQEILLKKDFPKEGFLPIEFCEKIGFFNVFQEGKKEEKYKQNYKKFKSFLNEEEKNTKKIDQEMNNFLEDIENELNQIKPQKIRPQAESPPTKSKENIQKVLKILYFLILNDTSFNPKKLDQAHIYKIFTKSDFLLQKYPFFQKKKKLFYIIQTSLRFSLKISYDSYAYLGSNLGIPNDEIINNIKENDEKAYIGIPQEKQWKKSIENDVEVLWTLNFNTENQQISISRSSFKSVQCNFFQFKSDIVQSIWANLAFELYYATNDDDERYSIQTHEQFFRNICIQQAEEPLGYAPFYSGCQSIYY
ncbi:hypothetical protein IMG5_141830 [Ichthyophthirius multifiliis]|uniref:Pecanex C-terminal domain-containing protein n=1 Tax=Ichthyophthirius multifiliis TaxID=5932 RepID=G0QXE4_ICHMU|nr:hypothetical protein IMG5_141830 [Ichthyophthirius multifiliis]EGR30113.1 hypothetical protein IMG5_141830 [Ichthyophthirius multifiliis]|eukprot:XP_004031349.1 hypothetical protein IMG5_141830 [Ichthyophthirius multifiliis]